MTAIVADIRNKLNGSVFSKNRYGSYMRTKVTPVNPQSTAQMAVRNRLSTNSQAWRALTETQRQSWISAAPQFPVTDIFGNPKILAGNALYVALNNNLHNIGTAPIDTAPSPVAISALELVSLTATAGVPALSLVFTPTPTSGDEYLVVEATPQLGAGIGFFKNQFRQIFTDGDSVASPQTLLAEYTARFGTLTAGMKIAVRAKIINNITGQAGLPVQIVAIVGA